MKKKDSGGMGKMGEIKTLKAYVLSEQLSVVNSSIQIHRDFLQKYKVQRAELQKRIDAEHQKTEETIKRMNEIGLNNIN